MFIVQRFSGYNIEYAGSEHENGCELWEDTLWVENYSGEEQDEFPLAIALASLRQARAKYSETDKYRLVQILDTDKVEDDS
jgi:hypothetical protein